MALSLIGSNGLNHPSVQKVIKIAEEIAEQNRPLTTEILYRTAKTRLNLSRRGLVSIIQLLFNRKILVEGSKFTKETVLSNQYRRQILNYIKSNIGSHFSSIRKEVFSEDESIGSSGQLIWHLEMLIKFKLIKKMKVGNFTIFLPINVDEEVGLIYFLMKDPINKKILEKLAEFEAIPQSEVYKLINEKRERVYYRINNLIEHEIILNIEEEHNKICLKSDRRKILTKMFNNLS